MDIKEGFKQTNIGDIPIDWAVVPIMTIAHVKTGPFGSTLHESDYVREGTPIITVEHLGDQGIEHFNLPMVSDQDKYRLRNYTLIKDDIVFSRVGSVDRNSLIKTTEEGWLFSGRLLRIRTQDKRIHSPFLSYYFKTEDFKNRIRSVAVGQTMASLNTQIINNIEIAFPSFPEQRAIAEALSDVDALIAAQEALLAKKRAIKQGVMQELLTGIRRLPGFSGEWEERSLEEIGLISGSGVDKKIRKNEVPVKLLNFMDVYSKDFIYSFNLKQVVSTNTEKAKKCMIRQGDIFFTPSSEMPYDIGNSCISMEDVSDGVYSYHVVRLRLSKPEEWDLKFRSYIFKTKFFLDQAEKICAGSGQRYVISLSGFKSLKIYFPIDKEEQKAISEVISTIDEEIRTLEENLQKIMLIKKGMMQELLTGRIRLTGV